MKSKPLELIASDVAKCNLCENSLPFGCRPVIQVGGSAQILIAGQAPGIRVHESGVLFSDSSGDRLRQWMGISESTFYNPDKVAILPMGFCYPGTGKSGDLPPRPECAKKWRNDLINHMPNIKLVLVIGIYAQRWHLKPNKHKNLTQTVKHWEEFWPNILPLPHPSPRNNIWIHKNPWFEKTVIPILKKRIVTLVN